MAAEPEPEPGTATPPAELSRRRFLRAVAGFSLVSTLAMVAAPVLAFLVPPKSAGGAAGGRVAAGTVEEIPIGTAKVVAMGSAPTIVLNTDQGVRAYSAICPHLGCIVGYDETNATIVCPCHDGRFSPASGAVISGPPPAPLAAVATAIEEGTIYLLPG